MTKVNWSTVIHNIREARLQLQSLETLIADADRRSEAELQIGLAHAYHHLNVAWRARRASASRYKGMSDADFKEWGRFPTDLDL